MPAGDNLPIYITAKSDADLAADACNPLPDDTPDLSQFVVITKRGTCSITKKLVNLEAKNATRILYLLVSERVILTSRIENGQNSTFISLNSNGVSSGMPKYKRRTHEKLHLSRFVVDNSSDPIRIRLSRFHP